MDLTEACGDTGRRLQRKGAETLDSRLVSILLLAACSLPAAAQLPANARYAAVAADTMLNGWLYVFDAAGGLITTVPLPFQNPVVEMAPGNDALLIWQSSAVWRYDRAAGGLTSSPPLQTTAGAVVWGALDEDGGMIWGESFGSIFKSDFLTGANPRSIREQHEHRLDHGVERSWCAVEGNAFQPPDSGPRAWRTSRSIRSSSSACRWARHSPRTSRACCVPLVARSRLRA